MQCDRVMKKLKKIQNCLIAVLLSFAFASHATAARYDENGFTLSLGLYASSKPSAMVRKFRPMVSSLEKRMTEILGHPVRIRMQIAKDYQQGIDHLRDGKVDFSRFGAAPYVEAKKANPGLQILAIESRNRSKILHGIIATGLHSPIKSIADLKGKSFAFGNERSTSGRYVSQQYLLSHGISANELSRYEYLGRHDIVGTRVGAGDFAAGAMTESTFRKLLAGGEKIRELARFPVVSKPWVARSGMNPKLYTALKLALLETNDVAALRSLEISGFIEGTNRDYGVIEEAIAKNGLFFNGKKRNRVEWVLARRKDKSNKQKEIAVVESED